MIYDILNKFSNQSMLTSHDSIFISVIIPVRNAALYIRECIDAVFSSEYQNYECIIIDDGSEDNHEYQTPE